MIGIAARTSLLTLLLGLVGVLPATAQENPGQPAAEGIAVHGHWIIEVHDDGELVERREFDNELTANGARILVYLLTGAFRTTEHVVVMSDFSGCTNGVRIFTTDYAEPLQECEYADLTVSSTVSNVIGDNVIRLTGSFISPSVGAINEVATYMAHNDDPVDFVNGNSIFTSKALPSSISVNADQLITVTVEITFM